MTAIACACYLFLSFAPASSPYVQAWRAGVHAELTRARWKTEIHAEYVEMDAGRTYRLREGSATVSIFRRVGRGLWIGATHYSVMGNDGAGSNAVQVRYYFGH